MELPGLKLKPMQKFQNEDTSLAANTITILCKLLKNDPTVNMITISVNCVLMSLWSQFWFMVSSGSRFCVQKAKILSL